MTRILSRSPQETKKIGLRIGRRLSAGDVVALRGPLGSGKTTLVKGIARGLGHRGEKDILSPTFVVIHEYAGREKIFHLDWYRLSSVRGVDKELAEECFAAAAVTLVEWPERGLGLLPKDRIEVTLAHRGENSRAIRIAGLGARRGWAPARTRKP